MERTSERQLGLVTDKSPERRATSRFPLILDVRYVVVRRGARVETGSGRTIELSSAGLSFTADRPLMTGQKLEVSIDWPIPLDGGVQLQLIVSGKVIRCNGSATIVQIERHEFRTRRSGLKAAPPQESFG